MPLACLTCGRASRTLLPTPGLQREGPDLATSTSAAAHPGFHAAIARPVPERGAAGAPCKASLQRSSSCPAPGRGPERAPSPAPPLHPHSTAAPAPGPARREGGDCGEGGAPPASRGLERAWPRSRQRRAGTHCAARPGSAGSARHMSRGRGCWRASWPRPALRGARVRPSPAAAAAAATTAGPEEGADPASRSPEAGAPDFPQPPPPPPLFSSGRAPGCLKDSPAPFPA